MDAHQREQLENLIFAGSWTGEQSKQRFTQDSPILPQVWMAFASSDRNKEQELLINPFQGKRAGLVARELRVLSKAYRQQLLNKVTKPNPKSKSKPKAAAALPARIAHVPGLVAAELRFEEVLRILLPSTIWWERRIESVREALGVTDPQDRLLPLDKTKPDDKKRIKKLADWLNDSSTIEQSLKGASVYAGLHCREFLTLVRLVAAILASRDGETGGEPDPRDEVMRFSQIFEDWPADADHPPTRGLIWNVALNREAELQTGDSALAIKADAARRLFKISCANLRWAVIDSGIDVESPAFRDWRDSEDAQTVGTGLHVANGPHSRVMDCFDFTILRELLDFSTAQDLKERAQKVCNWMGKQKKGGELIRRVDGKRPAWEAGPAFWKEVETQCAGEDEFYAKMMRRLIETARRNIGLVEEANLKRDATNAPKVGEWKCLQQAVDNANKFLDGLIQRIDLGMELDWSTLEPFLHDVTPDRPRSPHGTQVAGILAADWRDEDGQRRLEGICPDIELIDLRVSDDKGKAREFEVIAALQFLLHLNARSEILYVHGANLSLSIPHDLRSFGCGRTRVCTMAEQLVSSGVVVVAAAGNAGSIRYETHGQAEFVGYQTASITDPGNAENVITVGATHRSEPHQYGVSYFSSRGPTGDGRQKPDLVAPGEKITTAGLGFTTCVVDGTSFAAPHASGAAALLMARHAELKGHPIKIKRILCKTATDLGRTPDFQGCGMLDVLRALQSI